MIKGFNEFSDDYIFESLINESILYFSPVFKGKLAKLSDRSEIAMTLLHGEGKDLSSDITFIDMSSEIGYLTFMPMDKAVQRVRRVFPDATDADLNRRYLPDTNVHVYNRDVSDNRRIGIYHSNNNAIKIGKFARKVLDSIDPNNTFNNSDIEEFVNDLKSISNVVEEFEILSGNEIENAYKGINYLTYAGTLGNSCMNDREFFKIYTENPESCRMLVLKEDGRIVARALIWKLFEIKTHTVQISPKPSYLMDRIYFIGDHHKKVMEIYAGEHGWAYKSSKDSLTSITYSNKIYSADMVVKVKPGNYSPYPYLDTFCRYDDEYGFLYNDNDSGKNVRGHLLRHVTGEFTRSRFEPTILSRIKDWWNK